MIVDGGNRSAIVVIGAGFGGVTALLKLYRGLKRRGLLKTFELILVANKNHHLYTPALYEIAAIPSGQVDTVNLRSAICIPIESIIRRYPQIRFVGGEVSGLDPERRRIIFRNGDELPFGYALLALGSETNFFGIPGLAEHAYPLKTFADAVRLRNRIEGLLRLARGSLGIIIGGAGATGVELSAELTNFLCSLRDQTRSPECRWEITLLETMAEILPGFHPEIRRKAVERLTKLGVTIKTGSRVADVSAAALTLAGGRALPYDLLIWSGGVRPPAVLGRLGLPLDERGWLAVNEYLESRPRVYAIGDAVSFIHPKTEELIPKNVPVAEAQARIAARNIIAAINASPRVPFRPLTHYPSILAVGGKYALTDLVVFKSSGFLGWLLKQLVELRYLLFILPWPEALRTWWATVYYSTRND